VKRVAKWISFEEIYRRHIYNEVYYYGKKLMSELRQRLQSELERQQYSWGHVAPDRWHAVQKYGGSTLLDVGCSNGIYIQKLTQNHKHAYGVDLLESQEWQYLPGKFVMADACCLPFKGGAFETIVSFETLEHVPDPVVALRDYHR
jgi:2-polyprenyl-3-methyl-5-hydroxy-6-metoxy-1,4-benzoquinol methylase